MSKKPKTATNINIKNWTLRDGWTMQCLNVLCASITCWLTSYKVTCHGRRSSTFYPNQVKDGWKSIWWQHHRNWIPKRLIFVLPKENNCSICERTMWKTRMRPRIHIQRTKANECERIYLVECVRCLVIWRLHCPHQSSWGCFLTSFWPKHRTFFDVPPDGQTSAKTNELVR